MTRNEYDKKWRDANKDKVAASQKKWREANRDKLRASSRQYRLEHPEVVAARTKNWIANNREKRTQMGRDWAAKNPDRAKLLQKRHYDKNKAKMCAKSKRCILARKYGLTPERFSGMIASQGGKCCICRSAMDVPHVDHCHLTGNVRGLLCFRCNLGIGHLRDSVAVVRNALEYLMIHEARRSA